MLKSAILALALSMSGGKLKERAELATDEVINVTSTVNVFDFYPELKDSPEEAREKLGKLLIAWSYWESTWDFKAIGDRGRSCGIMQVAAGAASGKTCMQLTSSAHEGYVAGLNAMKYLVVRCGGLRPALGAYASGKCGGVPTLVERRCKKSGAC
jgi:hypothetical protein